jgi:hypothetical protein
VYNVHRVIETRQENEEEEEEEGEKGEGRQACKRDGNKIR